MSLDPCDHSHRESVLAGGNIAARLSVWARRLPGGIAIAEPMGRFAADGNRPYSLTTFSELDRQTDLIAKGLLAWGVKPACEWPC